jgi:hypothetical protein
MFQRDEDELLVGADFGMTEEIAWCAVIPDPGDR